MAVYRRDIVLEETRLSASFDKERKRLLRRLVLDNIREGDVIASLRQCDTDRAADAAPGSGDQSNWTAHLTLLDSAACAFRGRRRPPRLRPPCRRLASSPTLP